MKIVITGGSGFIGRHLTASLLEEGHHVTAVGSRAHTDMEAHHRFTYIQADTRFGGVWQESVRNAEAVINLAGLTIFKRWSKRYKNRIYGSRIETTRNIVEALEPGRSRGRVLCSASAIGYYGDRGDAILTESEPPGSDFLAVVGRDWETEAAAAEKKGWRVVAARLGIVLGKNGGALSKMIPAFKAYAGGPIGSGNQWFSWIHMADLTAAMRFVLKNGAISGPVNFCAPNPVRNRELAISLGRCLNRPAVAPAPAFIIRALLGEMGTTLLASQRVIPEKLTANGFTFAYPDIGRALESLVL